ncbi:amino acid ABC transporter substrate-binding protein [Thauera sp. Sel9]|uniref:amino acid ABC transporter substrate-binding protein n=1 Tax=Thauera sp. Sel9 TaxID=2974299 RepID=UPI0021E11D2A|nr:amino acid ABC transporter substrate-binding protein [Thauera sp. Sel9]MCV2217655.1 amino acid ABC transporter substrate-binding protein [Thauera sp. Sel9]
MALPIRFCLLVCGLFAAAGAAAMTLTVQNEPHLAHARALVQEALRVGGLTVDMVDASKGNERRNVALISEGLTHIDMMPATPTRLELVRSGKLRMIPIPLDRGLLGYRVNLLLESRRDMLAGVRTAEDLRAFSLGQNVGWMDVEIYRAAGIPTKEIKDWADGEFALQMEAGFLDLFPLGLEETLTHFLPHFRRKYPQLTIDPHVIVRYPWFRFVWVSPKPEADEVFDALQRGFDEMVANGRFLEIWQQYRKPPPDSVFKDRVIIDIPNPFYGYDLVPPKYRHLLFEDRAK